jgi:hypothetical protein
MAKNSPPPPRIAPLQRVTAEPITDPAEQAALDALRRRAQDNRAALPAKKTNTTAEAGAAAPPPRDEQSAAGVRAWSDHVAALAVDALIDAGLIRRDDFEKAAATVSEEVFVRLCLLDYPPADTTRASV